MPRFHLHLVLPALAHLAFSAQAEPPALQFREPLDYQVIQRTTATEGTVRISGEISLEADTLEARLGGDWRKVADLGSDRNSFEGVLAAPAGGWHLLEARALKEGRVVAEAWVDHVGVGEVFVVAGQSNAANHGSEKQLTRSGRVAAFDGKAWQLANDPQPGASGNGGSFMPPFADALVERFGVPVGMVAVGVGATSVREWLPRGTRFSRPPTLTANVAESPDGGWESRGNLFGMLAERLKPLGPHGFRAVLWHQGESDANQADATRTLPGIEYEALLTTLVREARREIGWDFPWFVALASYHSPDDPGSPEIRAAQKAVWEAGVALEGPDSDALNGELRDEAGRGVHFSGPGLRAHAAAWVEKVAPWLRHQLEPSEEAPGSR